METAIQLVTCLNRKIVLVECVPSHRSFYESFGFKLAEAESLQPEEARQLRARAIAMRLNLETSGTTPRKKPNLLVTMLSPNLSPRDLRMITILLRSNMPLEIWLPGCLRAQGGLTNEIKSIEASETSVAVHAAGNGHVRELAQAIAQLLDQFGGLSVSVRGERNGQHDFQAAGGEAPDWETIQSALVQLLQWTESTTLNARS